jgi:hypothetical protein
MPEVPPMTTAVLELRSSAGCPIKSLFIAYRGEVHDVDRELTKVKPHKPGQIVQPTRGLKYLNQVKLYSYLCRPSLVWYKQSEFTHCSWNALSRIFRDATPAKLVCRGGSGRGLFADGKPGDALQFAQRWFGLHGKNLCKRGIAGGGATTAGEGCRALGCTGGLIHSSAGLFVGYANRQRGAQNIQPSSRRSSL